jgi:hypothetical protein
MVMVLGAGGCNPDAYSLYVLENYGSVRGEMFDVGDDSFAVLDKPQENRMIVAHASNFYPLDEWRQVAAAFLERDGRDCDITQTHPVTPRQIEFYYLCG